MTQPLADVHDEALRVIGLAGDRGLTVRLIGGTAVAHHAHGEQPAALRRTCADIDVVVRRSDQRKLRSLLEASGYVPDQEFNAVHGARRLLYYDRPGGRQFDVFVGEFRMCHQLDLDDRLKLDPVTLTPADLLLTKLQVVEVNAKDLTDAASLLLWHEIGDERSGDVVGIDRLIDVTSRDWGWFITFTENLAKIGQALPNLPATEAALVTARATRIRQALEQAPKTVRWRARARVGRHVPWYELPEEVGGTRAR
jgi:Uncharacterised nucleotidyltransferase